MIKTTKTDFKQKQVFHDTMDVSGKATFGSDVEIDGKLKVNSASDIVDESGLPIQEIWIQTTSGNELFEHNDEIENVIIHNAQILDYMGGFLDSCINLKYVKFANKLKSTNMQYVFTGCINLLEVNGLTTDNVTNMTGMFFQCNSIISIPEFNAQNVTNMTLMFFNCFSLEEIHMTGMSVSFDIHWSTKMQHDAILEVLNNLATVSTTQTLTLGSTLLGRISDDEKKIATDKGWTLA